MEKVLNFSGAQAKKGQPTKKDPPPSTKAPAPTTQAPESSKKKE